MFRLISLWCGDAQLPAWLVGERRVGGTLGVRLREGLPETRLRRPPGPTLGEAGTPAADTSWLSVLCSPF